MCGYLWDKWATVGFEWMQEESDLWRVVVGDDHNKLITNRWMKPVVGEYNFFIFKSGLALLGFPKLLNFLYSVFPAFTSRV